ncbi:multiple 7 [Mactra antiquata]
MDNVLTIFRHTFILILFLFCGLEPCECNVVHKENGDNCTIPDSQVYSYTDEEGNKLQPNDQVFDGAIMKVDCLYPPVYDYYNEDGSDTVRCINGTLSHVLWECSKKTEEKEDTCKHVRVRFGKVKKDFRGDYSVVCSHGYTLNIPTALREISCKCENRSLRCAANIRPKCNPDSCVVPLEFEIGMTIFKKTGGNIVYLSAKHVSGHNDFVFFNCSKEDGHLYEPSRRRFQCVYGNWTEADKPSYIHGNNGSFPKCRKAICDSPCENGGTCIRDNECRCNNHLITGERCQTILCHENCTLNGGECVRPGICGNCPLSRSGRNCEIQAICDPPCENGGTCIRDNECRCNSHWITGERCQTIICDPPCENGGTCIRDNECRCNSQFITGERCQTILCHKRCTINGGECVGPGVCGNCPLSRSGRNCEMRDCTIPDSQVYSYTDEEGNKLLPNDQVLDGAIMKVECLYPPVYEYYNEDGSDTVRCINGTLSHVLWECSKKTEEKEDTCKHVRVRFGKVKKDFLGDYSVVCSHGYTLNIPTALREISCKCENRRLRCAANIRPKCNPDSCVVPLEFEIGMTIFKKTGGNIVYLSAKHVSGHNDFVFFNCSKEDGHLYEPSRRRFQCAYGNWTEADKPSYIHGNNGSFPKCRKAICDPPCENGGTCIRDNECRCNSHLITGERCQTILCHENCTLNGGECVRPGICGNCPLSRSGRNCEIQAICDPPCENGGTCIRDNECRCNSHWITGERCQTIICDPPCENGGTCIRDNECRCNSQFITGERCQTILCHENCTLNGGECVRPGICGNCPLSRSGRNCEMRDCIIPDSQVYSYTDEGGNELQPSDQVPHGADVIVECLASEYTYEDVSDTIKCMNGTLSPVLHECPEKKEEKEDSCKHVRVRNGKVKKDFLGDYSVVCSHGYTLNIPTALRRIPCKCENRRLRCAANKRPRCHPDSCVVPLEFENEMTIFKKTGRNILYLSAKHVSRHSDFVFFNCFKEDGYLYEPSRRRFQCSYGNWTEADMPSYIHGNNGSFPKCRKAICDPPCENGGTCSRDNECRCNSHLITGERCQTILCHENCTLNGGECVRPGICGNCPLSRSGRNCEIQGKQCDYIEDFPGRDDIYNGDGGNGTEVHFFCEDGFHQYGNFIDMSVCEVNGDIATWTPAPPTCYADAFVEVPENGNTTFEGDIIEHRQTYDIYCREGYELDISGEYNLTRMTIMNDNGTLTPEVPNCILVRCNPSYLDNVIVSYLNKTPSDGLFPQGVPVLYSCIPGHEFKNKWGEYIRGSCDLGKFLGAPECIPSCFIPDNRDYTYMKENGVIVSSHNQIRHGETLYVKCSSDENSTEYNDYYDELVDSIPEMPQALPIHSVNCKNGILSKPGIKCGKGLCEEIENGTVDKVSYDTYKVICNQGYSLNLREDLDQECSCDEGQLKCTGTIPLCSPDDCMIPLDHDSSKITVSMGSVQMSGGTRVNHGVKVIVDCTEYFGNIMEPNNTLYLCRAGQWIQDDIGEHKWLDENNGTFPQCKLIKKGCQVPQKFSGDIKVNLNDGTEVSEHMYIRHEGTITLDCGKKFVKSVYTCTDGKWNADEHINPGVVKEGNTVRCKVTSSQQPQKPITNFLFVNMENVLLTVESIFKEVAAMADKVNG